LTVIVSVQGLVAEGAAGQLMLPASAEPPSPGSG
jgi:hypothetical protein